MKSKFLRETGLRPLALAAGIIFSTSMGSYAQVERSNSGNEMPLKNRVNISEEERIYSSDNRNDDYLLLHFTTDIPSPALLSSLSITPINYINPTSIYAHVPESVDLSVLENFDWGTTLNPADKIQRNIYPLYTRAEFNYVLVYLPSDLSTEEITTFVAAHELTTVYSKPLPAHILLTKVNATKLAEIADDNLVSWVSPAPRKAILGELFHFCAGAITPYGPQAEFSTPQKFVLQGSDWDGPGLGCADLTYHFENGTPDIAGTAEWDIVVDAMNEWVMHAGLTFTETPTVGLDNSLDIAWESGNHGDGSSFDGPSGTLAHAFFPQYGGEMHFDEAENWTVDGSGINLFAVAVHELGHALGLSHSENTSAVMAPFYAGVISGLHPDDIAGIQALYSATPCGGGDTYCESKGNNSSFEWIEKIAVAGTNNTSGNNSGYANFTGAAPITLVSGGSNTVTLTPGFSSSTYNEFWNIWIDYNENNTFDASELVYSGSGTGVVSGSFTAPAGASGTTRMRISMKYNANAGPCETFTYGEVEDYTVVFEASPPVEYCASKGNNSSFEWISNVTIGGLMNTSGNDGGYKDNTALTFTATTGTTSISLSPGFSGTTYAEFWRIWVDFNSNGTFEASELLYSGNGNSTVTGSINIPAAYAGVTTRMRVSMKYNGYSTPCETFTYGEVEDYSISISPAAITAELDENTNNFFLMYPNPVETDLLFIQTPFNQPEYQIFDASGRLVGNGTLLGNSIDVSTLTKGHYMIRLSSSEEVKTLRFIRN